MDECGECGGNNESCGGCTNAESCNYDPAATVDDGSCIVGGLNLTLTLLTDNYPGKVTWSVVDANGNTMAEGGPYSGQQTTYVEEFAWVADIFDLIFNDSYGDEMQYGGVVGDYELTDPDGNVLVEIVSGANFGSQAIDNFCVTSPAVLGCATLKPATTTPRPHWTTAAATLVLRHTSTVMEMASANSLPMNFCGSVTPAGTVTLDGDCNDANSTMYPNAPGTGIGIDNNCNGIIDADEEAAPVCPEDVTQDGTISVADVLAILAEFRMPKDCEYDVDGDEAISQSVTCCWSFRPSVQTVDGASEDTRAGGHKPTQPMDEQGVFGLSCLPHPMDPKLSALLCFILSIQRVDAQRPDSPVELFTLEPGVGDTVGSLPNANDIAHAAFMTMSLDDLRNRATDLGTF